MSVLSVLLTSLGDVKESIKKEVTFATSAVGETSMQYRENRTVSMQIDSKIKAKILIKKVWFYKNTKISLPFVSQYNSSCWD